MRPHDHFWGRDMTRRRFLGSTAIVAGTVAGADLLAPITAFADSEAGVPQPIPGGFQPLLPANDHLFHVFLIPDQPDTTNFDEQLTITDFNGKVAAAHLGGTGVGVDGNGAAVTGLTFDVDNRFFVGEFIGTDRRKHHGTFAFL